MRTRKETALDNDKGVTSPLVNARPNPSTTIKPLVIKLKPLTQKSASQSALDAVDMSSHHHPKHGHSDGDDDVDVSGANICQPSAKRTKTSNMTSPVKSSHSAAGRPHPRIILPRSPLPLRVNRVINPGAPDQKRVQRTSEEVAAAAKKREDGRLKLESLEREKIRMLAEMEAADEEEERSDERMAIRDITDLAGSKENTNAGDYDAIVTSSEEESIEVQPKGPAKMVRSTLMRKLTVIYGPFYQRKKPTRARGDIRAAVDKEKEAIRKKNEVKSKSRTSRQVVIPCHYHFSRFATVVNSSTTSGKKPTASKSAVKIPFGLAPGWQTKRSKASLPSRSALEFERASSPLGGLADDDAHAEQPSTTSVEHKTRKNEVHFLFCRPK